MKRIILFTLLLFISIVVSAQKPKKLFNNAVITDTLYLISDTGDMIHFHIVWRGLNDIGFIEVI